MLTKKQRAVPTPKIVGEHLKNPYIRTNIKLVGDSITAGQGGTGFSVTGEAIGSSIYFANVNTATCWANMLRDHVTANYNAEFLVELQDEQLKWSLAASLVRDVNTTAHWKVTLNNATATGKGLGWRFYGTTFTVGYVRGPNYGILDVYVDDVKIGELDAYGTFGYSQQTVFSGLTVGYHNVELRESGNKNASSSARTVVLEFVKFNKTATLKNWGVPGINSQWIYENRTHVITSDDDLVFMQIGTNERTFSRTTKGRLYHREIIRHAQSVGARIILMSANAAGNANEVNTQKMDDIDSFIRDIASEQNVPFISNYDAFLRHVINAGVTLESLMGDNLHPNDGGYKVMYQNIARECGLSVINDGLAY